MSYAELDYTNYGALGFILGFGLPTLLLVAIFTILEFRSKKTDKSLGKLYLISVGLILALAVAILLIVDNLCGAAMDSNKNKATQNIMQKYDVKNVDWDNKKTTASPTLEYGDNEVIIEANNGREYVFQYELNRETNEPTLKDMPIAGGAHVGESLSTADLLK